MWGPHPIRLQTQSHPKAAASAAAAALRAHGHDGAESARDAPRSAREVHWWRLHVAFEGFRYYARAGLFIRPSIAWINYLFSGPAFCKGVLGSLRADIRENRSLSLSQNNAQNP